MKIFKKILICSIAVLSVFSLTACTKKNENVATAGENNGGLVVNVGDCSLFVNGYKTYETITESNKNNSYLISSILKVENAFSDESIDENGSFSNYTKLFDKIAGYEITNLNVFGDYLFFTTPARDKYSSGSGIANDLTDFYRIKIDGSKGAEKIIRSGAKISNIEFGYYCDGSTVYLMTVEDSNLYRVICSGSNIGKKIKVAENVSEVLLPSNDNDVSGLIYFTTSLTEDDSSYTNGNKICTYDIVKNSTNVVKMDNKYTYTLVGLKHGYLYFYAKDSRDNAIISNRCLYRVSADQTSIAKSFDIEQPSDYFTQIAYSYSTSDVVYLLENKNDGVIVYDASKTALYLYKQGTDNKYYGTVISTTYSQVVRVQDEFIYCVDSSGYVIAKLDISSNGEETIVADFTDDEDSRTIYTGDSSYSISSYFDIDEQYIYYYVLYSSGNYYLYKSDIKSNEVNASLFGVLEDEDIPEEESEEEE